MTLYTHHCIIICIYHNRTWSLCVPKSITRNTMTHNHFTSVQVLEAESTCYTPSLLIVRMETEPYRFHSSSSCVCSHCPFIHNTISDISIHISNKSCMSSLSCIFISIINPTSPKRIRLSLCVLLILGGIHRIYSTLLFPLVSHFIVLTFIP